MTMLNPDSLNQLVNAIYHQALGAVKAPMDHGLTLENQLAEVVPVNPIAEPDLAEPSMTAAPAESPPAPPDLYYFMKFLTMEKGAPPDQAPVTSDEVQGIRRDFPILDQEVNGHPLIWFDNAATTQKPKAVIAALDEFYRETNSNVHRGAHALAFKATNAYESAREKVQRFLGASSAAEIIFLRGTTEAINLVAQTYGRMTVGKRDEILLTGMEHHSNIVPWQLLQEATGATIRVVPLTEEGELNLTEYERLLSRRTRIVALTHVSNVLGTINPLRLMIEMAHHYGACVLVDGAQAVAHLPVNVRELDADFYAFSGHKLYGPTGIGVLYAKKALLETMPPWQGGGSMIKEVTFAKTTYNTLPYKFEAGTGNIADAVGLGAAIDYLQQIGLGRVEAYERKLTQYALRELGKIKKLRLIGTPQHKTGVFSFLVDGIAAEDLARNLDRRGIAVRVGHHCAQPLMEYYGVPGTIRASLGVYNIEAEIDTMLDTIKSSLK